MDCYGISVVSLTVQLNNDFTVIYFYPRPR